MPVVKYFDETMEVKFGHGDVAILPDLEDGVPVVHLWNIAPQPLGTTKKIPDSEEVPTDVKLTFDNPQGIDILISQLVRAKAIYQQNNH